MNARCCSDLDAFLADELTPSRQVAFERHLQGCPRCAAQVRLQHAIDQLLASADQQLEWPPEGLLWRIEQRCSARQRRYRLLRRALLVPAAAAAVGATLWLAAARAPHEPPPAPLGPPAAEPAHRRTAQDDSAEPQRPRATVVVHPDSDLIALPVATRHPQVTIVWCYPVVKPAGEREKTEQLNDEGVDYSNSL